MPNDTISIETPLLVPPTASNNSPTNSFHTAAAPTISTVPTPTEAAPIGHTILGISAGNNKETPNDTIPIRTPLPVPPVASVNSSTINKSPAPTPIEAAPTGHTTILVKYNNSEHKDVAIAATALADDFILHLYYGTYFNVPVYAQAPFYYVSRSQYISVFSGW
ncbi:hypothetical protein BDR06DRAFT_1013475 [Suillus hirtellus]|nr:hypothetical protein BDR06DRAFT_1013475 [Suillus hirtellus]